MLAPGALGAIISIPHAGASAFVDQGVRATILHHELSHGEYFTNPTYATYAQGFWRDTLKEEERAAFRRFLGSEDYDTGVEDLMINEMQAYVMHTPDRRFFDPVALGLKPGTIDRLRATFLLNMPGGWLRDCTTLPPAEPEPVAISAPATQAAPAQPPRSRSLGPAHAAPQQKPHTAAPR
jgi:hypothetical protein